MTFSRVKQISLIAVILVVIGLFFVSKSNFIKNDEINNPENWSLRSNLSSTSSVLDNLEDIDGYRILDQSASSTKSVKIPSEKLRQFSFSTHSYYDLTDEELMKKLSPLGKAAPALSQIIKSYNVYDFELKGTKADDPIDIKIRVTEYSTGTPYLVIWNATYYEDKMPSVQNLIEEEEKYKSNSPGISFISNDIYWHCKVSERSGGWWTVNYYCYSNQEGYMISADFGYTPTTASLGIKEDYSDVDYESFVDMTKELDEFNKAKDDFIDFVKAIKFE